MQNKLVIFLHAENLAQPSWLLLNDAGEILTRVYAGDPELLKQIAKPNEVIVIVPSEDVVLTAVKLPKLGRAKLMQALPYALEEQLNEDIDALQFASGSYLANGNLPVVIVAKEKLQTWHAWLEAWHVKADVILPFLLCIPLEANTWRIIINGLAIVRMNTYEGFACDVNNLADLLTLALTTTNLIPELIHIDNYTSPPLATSLDSPVKIEEDIHQPEEILNLIAKEIQHIPEINLLQGSYRSKNKFSAMQKVWKTLGILVAVWLLVSVAYPIISYAILKPRLVQIQTGMRQIYNNYFPESRTMIAPQERLQEKIQSLSGDISQNKLLNFLVEIGQAKTPGMQFKRMEFSNNQLTLELIAASSADFSAFTGVLSAKNLTVKQQNATLSGAKVNAIVVIA